MTFSNAIYGFHGVGSDGDVRISVTGGSVTTKGLFSHGIVGNHIGNSGDVVIDVTDAAVRTESTALHTSFMDTLSFGIYANHSATGNVDVSVTGGSVETLGVNSHGILAYHRSTTDPERRHRRHGRGRERHGPRRGRERHPGGHRAGRHRTESRRAGRGRLPHADGARERPGVRRLGPEHGGRLPRRRREGLHRSRGQRGGGVRDSGPRDGRRAQALPRHGPGRSPPGGSHRGRLDHQRRGQDHHRGERRDAARREGRHRSRGAERGVRRDHAPRGGEGHRSRHGPLERLAPGRVDGPGPGFLGGRLRPAHARGPARGTRPGAWFGRGSGTRASGSRCVCGSACRSGWMCRPAGGDRSTC